MTKIHGGEKCIDSSLEETNNYTKKTTRYFLIVSTCWCIHCSVWSMKQAVQIRNIDNNPNRIKLTKWLLTRSARRVPVWNHITLHVKIDQDVHTGCEQ